MNNDMGDMDEGAIIRAAGGIKIALEGLQVREQLAALASVTAYLLAASERRYGRKAGKNAVALFSTMLRNATMQWLEDFRLGRVETE